MRRLQHRNQHKRLSIESESATSGLVVTQLAHIVDDVARDVFRKLGSGLPRSLYQVALLHHLEQSGLAVEVVPSTLSSREPSAIEREIILIDKRLIIECIYEEGLATEMVEVYRSRLGLDVKSKNYEMGLVMNCDNYSTDAASKVH